MSTLPARSPQLTRWSRGWRIVVAVLGIAAILTGSLRLSDDAWPFGPMSQYAFSPVEGDTVVITRVEGVRSGGDRVDIPLRAGTAGIGRAEIEAQIPAIRADPSLLQTVADGYARTHPDAPRFVTLWLVQDVTRLEQHVPMTTTEELATWPVR
jgi:hypothetical protein